jgi:predicted GNAT superfamily acetyltransferase
MTDAIAIRDVEIGDVDWLLALNNASAPHVNALTHSELEALLTGAVSARIVLARDVPSGALIAFQPDADYQSAHYRWFSKRFESFLYVDRVMIAEAARGAGLGRALYHDLEALAKRQGVPRITLEVNSLPPNPRSMAFHRRLGFAPVGELEHDGGKKRVVLMAKTLADAPPLEKTPAP